MSLVSSPPPPLPPTINNDLKPKRSVSFMKHATVTTVNDNDDSASDNNNSNSDNNNNNTIMVPTGAPGNVNRSSFRPGRRPGYVRKGPVQSDSEDDEEEEEIKEGENESDEEESKNEKVNGGNGNGIGSFSSEWEQAMASFTTAAPTAGTTTATATVAATTTTTSATAVRPGPGKNYVRRAPVNSDTESDEEKVDVVEPRRSSPKTTTTAASTALYINNKKGDEEENSDTDDEGKRGVRGLVRPMAQTKISGPGQNYVRKAPVTSDTEDDEDDSDDNKRKQPLSKSIHAAAPAVNSPAPHYQQPPHSGGSIHNRHLNTALGATTPVSVPGSGPHSRAASHDPYFAAAGGVVAGVGGMSSALSSPRSVPVATSPAYNPYTPPTSAVGMTLNSNASNSSIGNLSNLSNSNNGSNPHLASSASSAVGAASLANSMAIYQQQQQEMMMIMQQQQLQIATMQQQQQAYQLLVLHQQQQHQHQLQAVQQQHSRAASANGSVHTLESKNLGASDSDDDVPLGEKQNQLPQLPSLPQFSSMLSGSSSPPPSNTTITPASPTAVHYSPRLSVQQSPLLNNHNRQVSSSSIHSLSNGGAGTVAYLHQPISSSPLNPATSNGALMGQHQVYSGAHTLQQTSSQPRLSDFIEEEQDRLLREQHLQATAAALGGHTVNATGYNNGASLLTSSFPAGYRGSVASVMSLQQSSGIDRGSMNSLHSAGSSGSSGSNNGGNAGNGGMHRPTPSRDSFIPQMATTLIQQQQYLTQQPHLLHQQQQYSPYQQLQQQHQPSTLIHVEAKPPPPSAGLVGAISAMERDKKLAKAHGTNQLQFQHQQAQQQMMMNVEKERWLQEQRRMAWEAGQFPQQQHQQGQFQQQQVYFQQQGIGQPGMMMMQVPMQQQQAWTSADEEDDDKPLGAAAH